MFFVSKLYKVANKDGITIAISEDLAYLQSRFHENAMTKLIPNSEEYFVDFVVVENTYGDGYGISDVTVLENDKLDILMYQNRFNVPIVEEGLYAEMDKLAGGNAYYNNECTCLVDALTKHRDFWMSDCSLPEKIKLPIFVLTKKEFCLLLSSGLQSSTLICNISDY